MNKKIKSKTIESKITVAFTLFVIIFFVFQLLSVTVFFDIFYEGYQLDKVDEITTEIKKEEEELDTQLDYIAHKYNICIIRITDKEKTGLYNTKQEGCLLYGDNQMVSLMIETFAEGSTMEEDFIFEDSTSRTTAILKAIKLESDEVYIYSVLEDNREVMVLFKSQLLYTSLIAISIALVIAYYLSKKIAEPITKITRKAKFLGTKKHVNFEETGIKEIDDLVESLKLAQTEIGKTNALKRDLMANVSHDLKTPLTMIKAYAEMIRDISYKDKEKLDNHIGIIIDESDRLTLLVNDILNMSKLEAHKDVLNKEKFNLTELIKNIIDKYEIIKEVENYNFKLEAPAKAIIYADKSKLNQVIFNLINNAINYTGDDKTVTIVVKKKSHSHLVEIKDSGKGIKEEDLDRIWDKYYKNDKKHKRNVVSSGIGLSIVKEIFILHNYRYGVNTSSDGTTFYFFIK